MPLVNNIFYKCYGNVASNRKAGADRGWFPANRKLVEHPDIKEETKTQNSTEQVVPQLPAMNIDDGFGATCIDRLICHQSRSEAGKKAAEEKKSSREGIMKNIKDTKRLTAGVIVAQGVHSLNDPRFVKPFRARQAARREKEEKAAKFQRDRFLKIF